MRQSAHSPQGNTAGTITVADEQRDDAAYAIQRLHEQGLSVTMLTGDKTETAHAIGAALGLKPESIHAQATPESKSAFLEGLPPGAVMVGDGINDAAALAQADLGIAMASIPWPVTTSRTISR